MSFDNFQNDQNQNQNQNTSSFDPNAYNTQKSNENQGGYQSYQPNGGQQYYQPNGEQGYQSYQPQQPQQNGPQKKDWLEFGSLACGIASLIICCCSAFLSIPLGVLAIVFSFMYKKNHGKMSGMVTGGLVCGILGVAFGVISFILSFAMAGFWEEFLKALESEMSTSFDF